MEKVYDLAQKQDFKEAVEWFGGEELLRREFPLIYDAIQSGHAYHCSRAVQKNDALNDEIYGRQDIFAVNILENVTQNSSDNSPAIPLVEHHFNYVDEQACVVIDTSVVDADGKRHGGNSYVFDEVYEGTQKEQIEDLYLDGRYELKASTCFSNFTVNQEGKAVLLNTVKKESKHSILISEGEAVVDKTKVLDPKNAYPKNIAQTYILYGKRNAQNVSYHYKNVPDPQVIGGKKYVNINCPFKVQVNLNKVKSEGQQKFTFVHNDPLSDVDFSIALESGNPNKYGGGGVFFNNDFKKIKKTLSEDDTVLTLEIPEDWKSKLTVNDLNIVIGEFKFRANFNINYNYKTKAGVVITRMATIIAETDCVITPSSDYVEPLKIQWGCIGRKTKIHTSEGIKPVGEVHIGDRILASDGTFVEVTDMAKGFDNRIVNIQVEGSEDILQVTFAHGVQTKRGVIPACDIVFEDEVKTADGSYRPICFIEWADYEDEVYDIETKGHALFLGSGIVIADKEPLVRVHANTKEKVKMPPEFIEELKRWTKIRNQ